MVSITKRIKRNQEANRPTRNLKEVVFKKSPIASAIEFQRKKLSEEFHTQPQETKPQSPAPKNPNLRHDENVHQDAINYKINYEINGVKSALKWVETLAENKEQAHTELSSYDFGFKGFSTEPKAVKLDKETLNKIQKIIREEVKNATGAGSQLGATVASVAAALGAAGLLKSLGGVASGVGKAIPAGAATTVAQNATKTATSTVAGATAASASNAASAAIARTAPNKAARLGAIFSKTMETNGVGKAITKTASLALPTTKSMASKMGAGAALGGGLAVAFNAADVAFKISEVEKQLKSGLITKEQADAMKNDIYITGGASTVGSIVGMVLGSVAGPVGSIAGSVAGGMAGEWVAKNGVQPIVEFLNKPSPNSVAKSNQNGAGGTKSNRSSELDTNVEKSIGEASKDFGIDSDEMTSIAEMESSSRSDAKNVNAVGMYQFMPKTWNNLIDSNKDLAEKYGINKVVDGQQDDRLDAKKSAVMYAALRTENLKALGKFTSGNKTVDVYLTHLLGAPTALNFLRNYVANPGALVTTVPGIRENSDVYQKNLGVLAQKQGNSYRPRTLQQVIDYIASWATKSLAEVNKRKQRAATQRESETAIKHVNSPVASDSIPGSGIVVDNSPKATKVSDAETKIMEMKAANKSSKPDQQQVQPIIVNQPQARPTPQTVDASTSLETRNDSVWMNAVMKQELERVK